MSFIIHIFTLNPVLVLEFAKSAKQAVKQEVKSVLKRESYTAQLINSEVWWEESLSPTSLNAKTSTCALSRCLCRRSWIQTESTESNKQAVKVIHLISVFFFFDKGVCV